MSTGHKIYDQSGLYFLTFTIVDWIDVFIKSKYMDIIIDSLKYCRQEKGLMIGAYVIMTNHVHLIVKARNNNLSDVIRDLKRHTAKKIISELKNVSNERNDWILSKFAFSASRSFNNYQVWMHRNRPIELESLRFIKQKLTYIHMNPVNAGLVRNTEHWVYSSERNYMGLRDVVMNIDPIDM